MRDPGKEARAAAGLPVIPALDGFRAFAILGIVVSHVLLFSGYAASLGGLAEDFAKAFPLGVDALFIISGFVVFMPTVARGGEFGSVVHYAIRRAARLVPAYWLVLLLLLVLMSVAPPSTGVFAPSTQPLPVPSFGDFAAHVIFIQTPLQLLDADFAAGLSIDGPLWTLSVEIGFYLALPLIATSYYRRPLLGLCDRRRDLDRVATALRSPRGCPPRRWDGTRARHGSPLPSSPATVSFPPGRSRSARE